MSILCLIREEDVCSLLVWNKILPYNISANDQ